MFKIPAFTALRQLFSAYTCTHNLQWMPNPWISSKHITHLIGYMTCPCTHTEFRTQLLSIVLQQCVCIAYTLLYAYYMYYMMRESTWMRTNETTFTAWVMHAHISMRSIIDSYIIIYLGSGQLLHIYLLVSDSLKSTCNYTYIKIHTCINIGPNGACYKECAIKVLNYTESPVW